MQIQIRLYQKQDQAGIDLMMAEIVTEFASPITQAVTVQRMKPFRLK